MIIFVTVQIFIPFIIVLVGTNMFGMKKWDLRSEWPLNEVIPKFVESSAGKNIMEPINIISNVKKRIDVGCHSFMLKIKTSTKTREI